MKSSYKSSFALLVLHSKKKVSHSIFFLQPFFLYINKRRHYTTLQNHETFLSCTHKFICSTEGSNCKMNAKKNDTFTNSFDETASEKKGGNISTQKNKHNKFASPKSARRTRWQFFVRMHWFLFFFFRLPFQPFAGDCATQEICSAISTLVLRQTSARLDEVHVRPTSYTRTDLY